MDENREIIAVEMLSLKTFGLSRGALTVLRHLIYNHKQSMMALARKYPQMPGLAGKPANDLSPEVVGEKQIADELWDVLINKQLIESLAAERVAVPPLTGTSNNSYLTDIQWQR